MPFKDNAFETSPFVFRVWGCAGEELQPEEPAAGGAAGAGGAAAPAAAPAARTEPDPLIVAQLVSMGFEENGCKRAALATGNSNAEAAMEWVLGHMEDPDFNDPLPGGVPGRPSLPL